MTFNFTITKGDCIELIQLLKAVNLVATGGEAKMMVDEGFVYLNGEREERRRAKIRPGDKVEIKQNGEIVAININK
jgi:ribosome-associated protein